MNPYDSALIVFGVLAVIAILFIVLDDNLRPWGKR